jgi:hypothetical protein
MKRALVLAALVAGGPLAGPQLDPAWRQPFDPTRIVGSI